MKIWYQSTLNFDQHPAYEAALVEHCARVASSGTEVVVRGRPRAIGGDLNVADYASTPIMYHSIVAPTFVSALLEAEAAGADAFIVGSFSEPILTELRSLAEIPVVSMSESSFMAASMNAPKVGLITLNDMVLPFLEKSKNLHKWHDRLSGVYVLEGAVSEDELERNFTTPGPYLERLASGVRGAIRNGAQAVIPAEGMLAVMAAANGFTEVDGVPVIDCIGTPVLFAELAVALRRRTGLTQSRTAYPRPSAQARGYLSKTVPAADAAGPGAAVAPNNSSCGSTGSGDAVADLAARVRLLEDHIALYQALSTYGPSVDSLEIESAVGLWEDDGVYDLGDGFPEAEGGVMSLTGHEAIRDLLEAPRHADYVSRGSAHVMTLPLLKIDGDRAVGIGYHRVYVNGEGGASVARLAASKWEWRRQETGEWKAVRRTHRTLDGREGGRQLLKDALREIDQQR